MSTNDAILNDLIGSRICHDLISPLGAIGNGVELLTMSGSNAPPELALISESVENANARIRFYRVAFGAAPAGTEIGANEVRGILRDMYRGGRLRIDWTIEGDMPRGETKLAFLLLQCLESAMPWGGTIRVQRNAENRWTLAATAERQKYEQELWAMLSDPRSDMLVTPSEVHFALVHPSAQRAHRKVSVQLEPQRIILSF